MISDYKFNEPNSAEGKTINEFLDELKFDQRASSSKSNREVFVKRYYDSKRRMLASGFSSLTENPRETYDRIRLIIEDEEEEEEEEEGEKGTNSDELDEKTIAILDELLEYKSITTS